MVVGPHTDVLEGGFVFGFQGLYLGVLLELFVFGEDDPVGVVDSFCVVSVCFDPCG